MCACALCRSSSVTVSEWKAVRAPRPTWQVPIRRGDGLVVELALKRDWDGRRRGVYGSSVRARECVNTARYLENRTCPSDPFLTLCLLVSVILTASSLSVPPCCKKGGGCTIPLTLTLLSARAALRFTPSRTSHVCMINASFTDVFKGTNLPDGHSCVSQCSQSIGAEDVPASASGLEHVPFEMH